MSSSGSEGSINPIQSLIPLSGQGPSEVIFESVAPEDGFVLEASRFSNKGGLKNSQSIYLRVGDDRLRRAYRSVLSFDTSILPETAEITGATIHLTRVGARGESPWQTHGDCQVSIANGALGMSEALSATDWQAGSSSVSAGQVPEAQADGESVAIELSPDGLAQIQTMGKTQLMLQFDLQDDEDRESDWVDFASQNHPVQAYRPILVVQMQ